MCRIKVRRGVNISAYRCHHGTRRHPATLGTRRGGGEMHEKNLQCCKLWEGTDSNFLCLHCLGLGLKCHQKAGSRNKLLGRSWACGPAVAAAPSTGPPPDNECKWLPSNIIFTSDWDAAASTRTTLNWQSFRHEVVGSRNSWDRFINRLFLQEHKIEY